MIHIKVTVSAFSIIASVQILINYYEKYSWNYLVFALTVFMLIDFFEIFVVVKLGLKYETL